MVPVEVITHRHIERRCGRSLLLVTPDMQIVMVGAPIGEAMNEPRIPVVRKDDRLVSRENRIELAVCKSMGMFRCRLQGHQVDHVHYPHLGIWKVLAEQVDGGKSFQSWNISSTCHDDVGLAALIGAGPFPDPNSNLAMLNSTVHVQPLQSRLFARDDYIYVVPTAQAAIANKKQCIRVGWQVDADNIYLFVHHMIDEAGVLVAETVMVLPPNVRRQQVVERRDTLPPGDIPRYLKPFRVLIEHGIDDVNESFVAGEKTMASGQQVTLEPPLAQMFTQHFHHPSIGRRVLVDWQSRLHEDLVGDFIQRTKPV